MPLYYLQYAHDRATDVAGPKTPAAWRSLHEAETTMPDHNRAIWAEQVTDGEPVYDHEGKAIPIGDYAITRSDGTVFGSEKEFFEQTYAPVDDLPDLPDAD